MGSQPEIVLSGEEVENRLRELRLDHWYIENGWIKRKLNTDGWPVTLMVVNAIGFVCEAAYHHADLEVTWGRVIIKLKTHSAGGITAKDLEVADRIEKTVLWRPPSGSACEGNPGKFVFHKG